MSSFANRLPVLAARRKVGALELQGPGHTADIDRPLSPGPLEARFGVGCQVAAAAS